jgi:hypothetical protein
MATINDIVKGFRLLAKYEKEGMEAHIGGADHDVIFGSNTKQEDIDICDQAELMEAGWHWSREYDCWCCFV